MIKKKILGIICGIFLLLLSVQTISAGKYSSCEIYGNCKPVSSIITGANYSINVNNSNYLQGYTPTNLMEWLKANSLVPYTGANQNVNLGNYNFSSKNFFVNSTSNNIYIGNFVGSILASAYNVIAIGDYASFNNTGHDILSFGVRANYNNTGSNSVGIGTDAGKNNRGDFQTAIGADAGTNNSAVSQIAIGGSAGLNNIATFQTAIGTNAGHSNIGTQQTAIGSTSGKSNTGARQTAIGTNAGYQNTGVSETAVGSASGYKNVGTYQTVIGVYAGYENKGHNTTGIGYSATDTNKGHRVSSFGFQSLLNNIGNDTIAIGYQAGSGNSLNYQFIVKQASINGIPLIQGNFSSGNLGIGTTNPFEKLHVNGSILANGTINATTDLCIQGGVCLSNVATTSGSLNGTGTYGYIPMWNGTKSLNNSAIYQSGSNVGIGTTSPQVKLDVSGIIASGIGVGNGEVRSYQGVGGINDCYVSLKTDTVAQKTGIYRSNVYSFPFYYDTGTGDSVVDATFAGASVLFNIADVEKMRVANNGKVGIGTTNPFQKLHVNGSILANGTITTIGYVNITGSLNQTKGNSTINNVYGGMWYHNNTLTEVNFASDGVYYPLFMTNATNLNGFSFQGGFNTLSNLTTQIKGVYQAGYMATGSGVNNHLYRTSLFINGVEQELCGNSHKMTAGGDIITQSGICIITLEVGDKVSLRTADVGDTGTGAYYSSNLNLIRIGN